MDPTEEEDWHEAAFSSRHVHNRVARHGGGHGRSAKASFDVRRSFGTYEVNWGVATKAPEKKAKPSPSALELFRLTHDGNGIVGEIHLRDAVAATVLLAGSRATLGALVAGARRDAGGNNKGTDAAPAGHDSAGDSAPGGSGEEGERDDAATDVEERERRRFRAFEKNSFRSPKFWFSFRGRPASPSSAADGDELSGTGYLVFSGNQCPRFQGTISCEALGWDNVPLSGWKAVQRSERDTAVQWGEETM